MANHVPSPSTSRPTLITVSFVQYATATDAIREAASQYPIGYSAKCNGRTYSAEWYWGSSLSSHWGSLVGGIITLGILALACLIAAIVSCVFCCAKPSGSTLEMTGYDRVT